MKETTEIILHYTFGVVRVISHHLEPIYVILREHNLVFARRSNPNDPCREEIEIIRIFKKDALLNASDI